jgi:hypothetical protein
LCPAAETVLPNAKPPVLEDREVVREFVAAVLHLRERDCRPRAAWPAALARRCVWYCICEAIVT